jgi:hypothetical protein
MSVVRNPRLEHTALPINLLHCRVAFDGHD